MADIPPGCDQRRDGIVEVCVALAVRQWHPGLELKWIIVLQLRPVKGLAGLLSGVRRQSQMSRDEWIE